MTGRPRLALALTAALAGPAGAAPELRADDAARLGGYEATVGTALMEALNGGAAGDVAALTGALAGRPLEPAAASPEGDWTCRTMKLGGALPLVVYGRFRCRITANGDGTWLFEKLSGSQRTRGTIWIQDGRAIYAGTGYVNDNVPTPYDELPDEVLSGAGPQETPDVAVFEHVGGDRARLIFPAPHLESRLDVLELTR